MTRIVIVGIGGRMGREVTSEAEDTEHVEIVAGLESPDSDLIGAPLEPWDVPVLADAESALQEADVAVDFSTPQGLSAAAEAAASTETAMVSGTTGLDDSHEQCIERTAESVPVLRAANFSVGINILTSLVSRASEATEGAFDVEISEAHHRHKRDAPSGTALALGEAAAKARGWELDDVACWSRHGEIGERDDAEIGFQVVRGGGIAGEHTVALCGEDETIEITHRAGDRSIFASGALRAAEWINGQPAGRYSMDDVLFSDG